MSAQLPRIGIDYTAAIQQSAGIGRSVRELVRAMVAVEPGIPLTLFVAGARGLDLPPPPGETHYARSIFSERTQARLWHRLKLPIPVERWTGGLDLFHAADFALPPTKPGTKTIVTIHDLAFERYPEDTMPGMLAALRRIVPDSVARADHVIAVSEATRQDLIDLYNTPPHKVTTILHGVAGRFHARRDSDETAAIRQKYSIPDAPVILTVGTLQPRKNHLRLVQAFAQMTPLHQEPPALVIAGAEGWSYEPVMQEVQRLKIANRVIFTGRVDDGDLPALYRTAGIFAYPALYEGFGLPALEAMACGVPVVASNASSLPEVVGDAGVLIDPHDVGALSSTLDHLLSDEALRGRLAQRGTARARQFTWVRAAEQTWDIYEQVLSDL